jgi:hypothetical protein
MDQAAVITNERKKTTDWQLFTNDGKFDSIFPPSQRLLRKSRIYYSHRNDSRLPRVKLVSRKSPTIFILSKGSKLKKKASNESFEAS